jgi:membrane protease subunit HflC
MRKWLIALAVILLLSPLLVRLALATFLFTVDRSQYVYVTQLGRPIATYDGANDEQAGLHVRWPWPIQSLYVIDRRLQSFDLSETELLTHDAARDTIDRTLAVSGFVCWKIADARQVDRFVRTVGAPDRVRSLLGQQITSQFGASIGRLGIDDLVNTEPGRVDRTIHDLRQKLLDQTRERALADYGIDIVDIRMRRHGYPLAVRPAIFERITSERNKKVAEYQSEGDLAASQIRSSSERDARAIVADARAREQELKGRADAEADRIRGDAHAKDPEFYAFLKKLEEYQKILADNKTVLLLSSHRELFDLLFSPPTMNPPGKTKPAPTAAADGAKNGGP